MVSERAQQPVAQGVISILSNFEVTVEKLVYGGDGLGRLDGRVVLAPFVLPGERILAQPDREKPGLIHARMVEVLEPSPRRVAAACPYFGRCGGCHYQHASYEHQVEAKREILAEELRRLGKIEPPGRIETVVGEPWGYRNRAQFHLAGGKIGYLGARSHKLCGVEQCPVASPKVNETLAALAGMMGDPRWPGFVRTVEVFTDERQVQLNVLETDRPPARRFFEWCAERIPGMVPGTLDYTVADATFRVGAHSFFQVNRFLTEELVQTAIAGAEGETALDLYAGVGLFSIPLASRFRDVTAVESGAAAVRDLVFNAERAGRANIRAERNATEAFLQHLDHAPDFVLLDPPRAGLGPAVVRRLGELRPRRLALVACDASTLARDLAGLLAAGYAIEKMTLVDLFPQTYHFETVVALSLA